LHFEFGSPAVLRQGATADPLAGKKLHLGWMMFVALLGEPVDELVGFPTASIERTG